MSSESVSTEEEEEEREVEKEEEEEQLDKNIIGQKYKRPESLEAVARLSGLFENVHSETAFLRTSIVDSQEDIGFLPRADAVFQDHVKRAVFQLEYSDPGHLFHLYATLSDTSALEIQKKYNTYLQHVTNSKLCFLIHLPNCEEECLISVIGTHVLYPVLRLQPDSFIIREVCTNEITMIFSKRQVDPLLLAELVKIMKQDKSVFKSLMVVPFFNTLKSRIAFLIGLVNFEDRINCANICSELVSECFRFSCGTITNSLLLHQLQAQYSLCSNLLEAGRRLCNTLGNAQETMRVAVKESCRVTMSKCGSFFVVNGTDLVSEVLNYGEKFETPTVLNDFKRIVIPFGEGILGKIMSTGQVACINDSALIENLSDIDIYRGSETRNILAFPLVSSGEIKGVIELRNKEDLTNFHSNDQTSCAVLSTFIAEVLVHNLRFKKLIEELERCRMVASMFIRRPNDDIIFDELIRIKKCEENHNYPGLTDFRFIPLAIPEEHQICTIMNIFSSLGLLSKFRINSKIMCKFLIILKAQYYDHNPVRNWNLAMSTFHFVFVLLNNLVLVQDEHVTPLEALSMLLASLSICIGEKEVKTEFQPTPGGVLAALYSSPGGTLNDFHSHVFLEMLIDPSTNILEALTKNQFQTIIKLVARLLRYADMRKIHVTIEEVQEMSRRGYDKSIPEDRSLLHQVIMLCGLLSDYSKPFIHLRKHSEEIFEAFFHTSEEGLKYAGDVFDLVQYQPDQLRLTSVLIQFMTTFCKPIFGCLVTLFPNIYDFKGRVEKSIELWTKYYELLWKKQGIDVEDEQSEEEQDLWEEFK